MPRRTVKLVPQQGDSHDGLASYQLQAELQSCVETDDSRMQDARRRLLKALESDFQDYEPTLRPSKRPPLEHQHLRPSKRRTLPWSRGPIDRLDLGGMPSDPRAKALRESTQSSRTQWPNERSNVPLIREADRARYQKWLESSGFPAASNRKIWEAICTNWIGFLSATGSMPKRELAPCRKIVTWEPRGSSKPDMRFVTTCRRR
jgi:hypothetical protein